jgi:hypothetical protein
MLKFVVFPLNVISSQYPGYTQELTMGYFNTPINRKHKPSFFTYNNINNIENRGRSAYATILGIYN